MVFPVWGSVKRDVEGWSVCTNGEFNVICNLVDYSFEHFYIEMHVYVT